MNEAEKLIARLAVGGPIASSPDLLELVEEMGLAYREADGEIQLAEPLELLSAEKISAGLTLDDRFLKPSIDIHWSIDSTNSYLMSRTHETDFHGSVCLAERQVSGRGRRGRTWVSPFGKNIYLSLGWQMPSQASGIQGLSLVVGMQVVKSLVSLGLQGVALKWPNDILMNGGKLSGILIEMGAPSKGQVQLVIGVGVNLQLEPKDAEKIDQPWSEIGRAANISRNSLVSCLVSNIFTELEAFSRMGFQPYQSQWDDFDLYRDQPVKVLIGERAIEGVNKGVDDKGNLILETENGRQTYNAGEVSLRGAR